MEPRTKGSSIARIASIYDKDPLLNDLSDASDNSFLTQLESNWRGHDSVNGIHRFCAYESEDTMPENGLGRYLKAACARGQLLQRDLRMRCNHAAAGDPCRPRAYDPSPLTAKSSAYDFFYRVYRDNPVLEEQIVTRENVIAGLVAACDRNNTNDDLEVPIALDSTMHEKVIAATASLINTVDLRNVDPDPPLVTRIDANGVAHINYGFSGPAKKLFVCLGTAHASLKVPVFYRATSTAPRTAELSGGLGQAVHDLGCAGNSRRSFQEIFCSGRPAINCDQFGRMLTSYEGWKFMLAIRTRARSCKSAASVHLKSRR